MKIITDHKWKFFKFSHEAPKHIVEEYNNEPDGYIKYRNTWYHLGDFLRINRYNAPERFQNWHGYFNESAFSGILI